MKSFKIVLLGSEGVGKTAFLKNLEFKKDEKDFEFETYTENFNIEILTKNKKQKIDLSLWDSGDYYGSDLKRSFYQDSDGVIVFFDPNDLNSFDKAIEFIEYIKSEYFNTCIVLCANKIDKYNKGFSKYISYSLKEDIKFCCISVLQKLDINIPILCILRKIYEDDLLTII